MQAVVQLHQPGLAVTVTVGLVVEVTCDKEKGAHAWWGAFLLLNTLTELGLLFCECYAHAGVGLTGTLYADREPFASWARHLASFGCQANAVAGSAYYKLLIGQLLGYKQENVLAYVAASGEPASAELQKQVGYSCKRSMVRMHDTLML